MIVTVVTPAYEENPENQRCELYVAKAAHYYEDVNLDVFINHVFEFGPKVDASITDVLSWTKRDRAIAKCRWDGTAKAFDNGAEWVIQVDSDVMVPHDFFYHMINAWKNAEAKTCHIKGTDSDHCRHIGFPSQILLPDDIDTQPIAGEVIMLKKSLWERMNKDYMKDGRMNEDLEIAEKVRAAGAVYHLVDVICYSD